MMVVVTVILVMLTVTTRVSLSARSSSRLGVM